MTAKPDWSADDTEAAVALWKSGATAGAIAEALEHRHTRNAVLGKMNRMGLMRNPTTHTQPRKRAGRHKPVPHEVSIRRRHEDGQRPSAIANALKMPTEYVVSMMESMGIDPMEHVPVTHHVHPMWSMEEDARRLAFWDKFRTGWVEVQERLRSNA